MVECAGQVETVWLARATVQYIGGGGGDDDNNDDDDDDGDDRRRR